ncbi:MAG: tetratricopeptide repeat protein [Desulfobacterales bacterium]|nr:tetratricopeptide repeat protein [Desulfobacterales bacterium]
MKFKIAGRICFFFLCITIFSCATADFELKKKQAEAQRSVGEAYMASGDYSYALIELLKGKEMYAEDSYLMNSLGLTYLALKRYDLSIESFKSALKIKPDYAPARNNLGSAYLATQNWDMAISTLLPLTEDVFYGTPHFPPTNIAWAFYNKKDYIQSEKYYKNALMLKPDYEIAMRGLGKTYIALGKYQESIEILEQAIEVAPRFAELYIDLGDAYTLSRNYVKALETYNIIIQLAPGTIYAETASKKAEAVKHSLLY